MGPEMAAPILCAPGKNAFFLQEKPFSIKFRVLGGGVILGFFGGGSADFIFMGARIFLKDGRGTEQVRTFVGHLPSVTSRKIQEITCQKQHPLKASHLRVVFAGSGVWIVTESTGAWIVGFKNPTP